MFALLAAFEFSIFCEAIKEMRARVTYYSADEVSRLLWEENDDSELESGTSEEEEAELEHQLRTFNEESLRVSSERVLNFSWLFKFRLDLPLAAVIPVISMK